MKNPKFQTLPLKNKNELSKTFSKWLTITKYHPSTIFRADTIFCSSQEEFEVPKGQSETVYRRTDNTMAKRKSTKGQTTIGKTYI
jgi:hypothetical protein